MRLCGSRPVFITHSIVIMCIVAWEPFSGPRLCTVPFAMADGESFGCRRRSAPGHQADAAVISSSAASWGFPPVVGNPALLRASRETTENSSVVATQTRVISAVQIPQIWGCNYFAFFLLRYHSQKCIIFIS